MRDTADDAQLASTTWAAYVDAALKGTWTGVKVTRAVFASRVGVARGTVQEWVAGRQVPDTYEKIRKVAEAAGHGHEVWRALRAAGKEQEAQREIDATAADAETIRMIEQSNASPQAKHDLIQMVHRRRLQDEVRQREEAQRDEARRREEIRLLLRAQGLYADDEE